MDTRGQPAAGAGILLIVIAVLIVLFVVLLPPQERAELLGENVSGDGDTGDEDTNGLEDAETVEELLVESPGRIDFLGDNEVEHPLPVVNIFTRTESEIIAEKNVIYTSRAVFSEEQSPFTFTIPDLENTNNVLLSFRTVRIQGRLLVSLNGETVYNGDGQVSAISLPRNLLQERNEFLFRSSSPGLMFWRTNEASLENVKIVADVTNLGAQTATIPFLVSDTEARNVERVILRFQPDCIVHEIGRLTITVNAHQIYSGIPDCDIAFVPIEFSPGILQRGENEVVFHTEEGTYLLSHVLVRSELKEVDFPTFFFEVSNEEFEDVENGDKRVRLQLHFVDVTDRKTGEVLVNGRVRGFDTRELSETIDISDLILRGNNAVKIKPTQRSLELRELRVELVE